MAFIEAARLTVVGADNQGIEAGPGDGQSFLLTAQASVM
jgi:hypothetical protein